MRWLSHSAGLSPGECSAEHLMGRDEVGGSVCLSAWSFFLLRVTSQIQTSHEGITLATWSNSSSFLKACLSPHSRVVSALLILATCSQVANHSQSVAAACLVAVSPLVLQHLKGSLCSFSYSTEPIISTSTKVGKEGVRFIDKFCSESLLIMLLGKHFFVKIMLENTD